MKGNNLIYETSRPIRYNKIESILRVSIRLNDEGRNGCEYFAVTGDIFKVSKRKTARDYLAGGCIHEEILKYFPEFKPFVDLHLCDYMGIPMHASANMLYHLQVGYDKTARRDEKFPAKFCEDYRIPLKDFPFLAECESETTLKVRLKELGIIDEWKRQADEAIKQLEELTGVEFESKADPKKLNIKRLDVTEEEVAEERERVASGFYEPEQVRKRKEDAISSKIAELTEELEKELKAKEEKARKEFDITIFVLKKFGLVAFNNCIYYDRSNEIAFNWKSYERKITPEEFEEIKKTPFPHNASPVLK